LCGQSHSASGFGRTLEAESVNAEPPEEATMFAVKDLADRGAQRVFGDFGTFMLRWTVNSLIGSEEINISHADLRRGDAAFRAGPDDAHVRSRDCHRAHS
jgi:hypothetical protein